MYFEMRITNKFFYFNQPIQLSIPAPCVCHVPCLMLVLSLSRPIIDIIHNIHIFV